MIDALICYFIGEVFLFFHLFRIFRLSCSFSFHAFCEFYVVLLACFLNKEAFANSFECSVVIKYYSFIGNTFNEWRAEFRISSKFFSTQIH